MEDKSKDKSKVNDVVDNVDDIKEHWNIVNEYAQVLCNIFEKRDAEMEELVEWYVNFMQKINEQDISIDFALLYVFRYVHMYFTLKQKFDIFEGEMLDNGDKVNKSLTNGIVKTFKSVYVSWVDGKMIK